MAVKLIGFQFTILFLIFGSATTLKPILDKSEIGEGEDFTVTCDSSRVILDPLQTQPIFSLTILRQFLGSPGSDFQIIMLSSLFGFRPRPEHNAWPWKPIFHFKNVSKREDQYIILHNTKSTCDDAGKYKCEVELDGSESTYYETQLLRKKASCDQITESSPLPAETAYTGVNGTDSNPYTEPSTQTSGSQVLKSFFIAETILLIVVVVSVK